jgi:signal transduction histidine kinase
LRSVAGACGNIIYAEAVLKMREEVATGQRLQAAMQQTKLFPHLVQQMVAIGEESGSMDAMLAKVADFYEEEVDNLVDNSIKYSVSPLEIMIKFKRNTKKIEIEFSDNGIGIQNDEIKKIFQKFHRIYDKDIPNVKGTGLGLYVVREIIKNHKGKVFASSEGKGMGSKFKIELPIYIEKNKSIKGNKKDFKNE